MYVCNGNLISKTEPHGYRITTGYNGLDMATSINYNNDKELTFLTVLIINIVHMVSIF